MRTRLLATLLMALLAGPAFCPPDPPRLSPPIICPPSELDLKALERLIAERTALNTHNQRFAGRSLNERMGSQDFPQDSEDLFGTSRDGVFFHVAPQSALAGIFRGERTGLRGNDENLFISRSTGRINRTGVAFGFPHSSLRPLRESNGKSYNGVPLEDVAFIAANWSDVGFDIVWVNPRHQQWVEDQVLPAIIRIDEAVAQRRARGKLGKEYLTPREAMRLEPRTPNAFLDFCRNVATWASGIIR